MGEATGEVVAVDAAAEMTATASWQQEKKMVWQRLQQHSISVSNNCHTVTVTLLKYLKGDNQPAQVDWWQCSKP